MHKKETKKHKTIERTAEISEPKRTNDAFSNPGANTGFGMPNLINTTEYPLTRLSQDWSLLTSLYRSSWIVQRVCSIIPEDALTDLRIDAPGITDDARADFGQCLQSLQIRRAIIEAMKWARLYGGAAAIMMIDGQDEDLSQPLHINDMLPGSFRGLFVVDRWSGIYPSLEKVDNPRSRDFGLPRYYEVRDEDGVMCYRVHHSRVLRFIGTQMPYYEAISEQQWGTSAIEAMYDDLVRRDNVIHNIANLTFKANLAVYEIENLDQIFASAGTAAQRRMYQMLQAMNILESNLGIRLVNKGDSVQQLQYGFGGLPEVLDGAMLDVSGSTAIPATRLFGRSPAGMNATGESDEKNYRDTLKQQRAEHIQPALDRLLPVVCKSVLGFVPAGAQFVLPNLDELSEESKNTAVDARAQVLERLFDAGVVPADTLLNGVRDAQLSVGLTSSITDEDVEAMRGKYKKDVAPVASPFDSPFECDEDGDEDGEDGEFSGENEQPDDDGGEEDSEPGNGGDE